MKGSVYFVGQFRPGKFCWRCRDCGWKETTTTDEKPDHRCEQKHNGVTRCEIISTDPITWLWTCSNCNWSLRSETNAPVDHVCGRGKCRHRGIEIGSVVIKCCPGGEARRFPMHACDRQGKCVIGYVPVNKTMQRSWEALPESNDATLCTADCPDREDA